MNSCHVVIVGAGPYGLCAASHLRTIKGLEARIFGDPMSFWAGMPEGMLLRSNWTATQMPDPNREFTLEAFQAETASSFGLPVPLDRFIDYGRWYQRHAVPNVDRRSIIRIQKGSSGFEVVISDGEIIRASRVIVAAGIGGFARKLEQFACFPKELVSHTSEHRRFDKFTGKDVLVIGGGQSALESAALMHESGVRVEVIARTRRIHWLQGLVSKTLHHRMGTFVRHVLYAPTDVGPAMLSQLLARPHLLQQLPKTIQNKFRQRAVRPAGARWLVARLKDVPIQLGRAIQSAEPVGGRVRVKLTDSSERTVDHLMLGTGYQVNISKYDFLSPELLSRIHSANGFPILRAGLETSVDGLHILGAPAAWTFGPIMQFVSGSTFASRELVKHFTRQKPTTLLAVNMPADSVSASV